MRGYVERLERLQFFADEGTDIGYDEVMDSYLEDADRAKEERKHG